MDRFGFTLHSGDFTIEEIMGICEEAERLSYDGFWLTEESGKEAFSTLTLAATRTKKLRIGTGIINIYSRTPTLIAMGVSTLDEISGGRAFLGLGTGGIGFIERAHGLKIIEPLDRMREYVTLVKKLLSWERFTYNGKHFNIRDFKLRQRPPRNRVPIYIAALNPKMTQLAGELADGVVVNMLTDQGVKEIREDLKVGAARSGRDPREVGIYALSMTLCGDSQEAVMALKKGVAFYCDSPHYHHILKGAGFGDVAMKVKEAWDRNKPDEAAELVPEELLKELTLFGSPKEVRARIENYLSKGVYPIAYPIVTKRTPAKDVLYAIRSAAGSK